VPNEPAQVQENSQQYDNELRGALFRNDKGDNPKRPDYRGRCMIGGKQFRMSGWLKTSHNGDRYMSIAFAEHTPNEVTKEETF